MQVDPDVIAALEDVVDREPGQIALGVHLGGLLLDAGRPGDALTRLTAALADAPADPAALALAARAAREAGERVPLRVLPGGDHSSSSSSA